MTETVIIHNHEDAKNHSAELDRVCNEWEIVQEIDEWVAKLRNNPVRWTSTIEWGAPRKKGIFHPSSLSKTCDMHLYLELFGAEEKNNIGSETLQIFDTGTVIHEQFQYYQHTKALAEGYTYVDELSVAKGSKLAPKIRMGGHCDGYMERLLRLRNLDVDLRCLWEYKTIKAEAFAKLRNKPEAGYVKQVQAYMALTGVPLTIILYYNKNTSLKKVFFVRFYEDIWSPIQKRLEGIVQLMDAYELPGRNINRSCVYCKFFKECSPPMAKVKAKPPRFK